MYRFEFGCWWLLLVCLFLLLAVTAAGAGVCSLLLFQILDLCRFMWCVLLCACLSGAHSPASVPGELSGF